MKPLEFLWYIVKHFLQLDETRFATLKEQSVLWEAKQKETGGPLGNLLAKSEAWYVQLALALALIITVKSISNWLVSSPKIDTPEDDDNDSDLPIFNSRTKKFIIN